MNTNRFEPVIRVEQEVVGKAVKERETLAQKFPLFFGLLGTFGFVATLYGFEKLIDKVDLFVNNPWILLATGVSILILTGVAFKKLS